MKNASHIMLRYRGENWKLFPKQQEQDKCAYFTASTQPCPGPSSQSNRQEKGAKDPQSQEMAQWMQAEAAMPSLSLVEMMALADFLLVLSSNLKPPDL